MEAAFFDLDKTIVARSAMLAYGRSFYREGLLSRRTIARSAYTQFVFGLLGASESRMDRMRDRALVVVSGWDRDHVAAIVRDALHEVVGPIVYAEALDLIRLHHDEGRLVVIVSSSPEEIVVPVAEHLGADHAIASRAEVDARGAYTGRLEFYAYGPAKAAAIRTLAAEHDLDLSRCYAYSDSVTDRPMLEAVGHPVAVNPDRELARLARERDWEIRAFRTQVGLPDQPSARSGVAAGVVLGAAGLAVAAAAVVVARARRVVGGAP